MLRLGVDVGGTFIKAGVVDENYTILHKVSVPTEGDAGYEDLVRNIARAGELAAREAGFDLKEFSSAGIGIPGLLNPKTGVVVLEDGVYNYYEHDKLTNSCHGTGDIYSSAFVGALVRGKPAVDAARIAADYTVECIRETAKDPGHWYGARFEPVLNKLLDALA